MERNVWRARDTYLKYYMAASELDEFEVEFDENHNPEESRYNSNSNLEGSYKNKILKTAVDAVANNNRDSRENISASLNLDSIIDANREDAGDGGTTTDSNINPVSYTHLTLPTIYSV